MNQQEIISSGILELYAAGLTDAHETRQVEQWLQAYPGLRAELDAVEAALESYAMAQAAAPSPGVKDRLMAELFPAGAAAPAIVPSSAPVRRLNPWKWAAAASIILSLGMGWVAWSNYQQKQDITKELASVNTELQQRTEKLKLHHHQEELLAKANVQPVVLKKVDKAPSDCVAMAYWDKNSGVVYIDPCRMPDAPGGKQYQLWAIVDGKPVDAGMIKTASASDRYSIQQMKSFQNATAFAVTLEKEGGSPTPTMDQMYVMGEV